MSSTSRIALRRWKAVALIAALIGCAVGCRKKPVAPAPPPAEQPAPPPVEPASPTPAPPVDPAALRSGERALAMFRLGLVYATGEESVQNRKRAREVFEELVALYPRSELRPQAELILELMHQVETLQDAKRRAERQIRELNQKLEQLKQIDLGPRPP